MAGGRHTTRGVDHDPHRRTRVGEARIAHGQRWVVGDRRPRAHDDGVGPGAEPLHVGTRRLAGDPSGGTVGRRGLAVEARRHLQGDVRKTARDVTFERPVEAPRLGGHHAVFDLDAGVAELHEAGRVLAQVRIGRCHHHARHPRVDQGAGAGRGATEVVARLERADHGGPSRAVSGCGQRHHLGVRGAGPFVPALAEHRAVAIVDDEGAHHGIGRHAAPAAFGELERPPHLGLSCCLHAPPRSVRPRRGGWRASGDATRGVRTAQPGRRVHPFPSIPTLTVGPGIPPGPPTAGCGRVADCHRRWGVAPRPGNGWLSAGQYTERGSDPASGRVAGPTRCVGRWRSCCRRRAWRTASSRWPRPPLRRSGRTRGWSCWRCRR